MKKILITAIIIIATVIIAWHRVAHGAPVKNAFLAYCPPVSAIKQNPVKRTWYAHTRAGFWKSYHLSFATDLTQYVGAQWVGENVGQIFCVYKSQQKYQLDGQPSVQETVPVVLVFGTLALAPKGGKWKNPSQGVFSCQNLKQKNCPFYVNKKPQSGNIFKEAEALKYQKSDTLSVPIN